MGNDSFYCPVCSGTYFGRFGENHEKVSCHDQYGISCYWRGKWEDRLTEPNPVALKWADGLHDYLKTVRKMQRQYSKLVPPEVTFPVPPEDRDQLITDLKRYIHELKGNLGIAETNLKSVQDSKPPESVPG
jgi:hypothetical protein